jgi:hypothetical protein
VVKEWRNTGGDMIFARNGRVFRVKATEVEMEARGSLRRDRE